MAPPVAWQTHPPQRSPEVPVKGLRARPEGRPGHGPFGIVHPQWRTSVAGHPGASRASLLVRPAKNDAEGGGAMLYLHRDTLKLVRAWLGASGIDAGRLFRSVAKEGIVGERLDESQVPRIYRAMAERAGLPGGDGAEDLRAQPPGGGSPGHDRVGDRDPGHHAGRALEERLHGATLRRAAPRQAQRRRTARAAPETQIAPKTPQGLPRRAPVA